MRPADILHRHPAHPESLRGPGQDSCVIRLLQSFPEGQVEGKNLGGMNSNLVRNKKIAQLVIKQQGGYPEYKNYEENRYCPDENVSQEQASFDFPEQFAPDKLEEFPDIYESHGHNEQIENKAEPRRETHHPGGKEQHFYNP